jgi:hypothetical protein
MSNTSDDVRVVPLDSGVYEVQLNTDSGPLRIGKVSTGDRQHTWTWQHRDGERSSPIATSLAEVVHALTDYHLAFKPVPTPRPIRRLILD